MTDWQDLAAANLDRAYQMQGGSPQDQARTALLQQQAQGAAIQNRVSQLQLSYQEKLPDMMAALQNGGGSPQPTTPGDPLSFGEVQDSSSNPGSDFGAPGSNSHGSVPSAPASGDGSGLDLSPAQTMLHMRARFAPLPTGVYSPQEQALLQTAALSGNQAAAEFVKQQHSMRIDGQNQSRNTAATSEYAALNGIATAPDGQALEALRLVDPEQAARLEQSGATDEQVRGFAAKLAGSLHVAAQLPVDVDPKTGIARDHVTGQEIPGYDQTVGMGADERVALSKSSTEKVDMPNSDGTTSKVPRWQAENTKSASDWVNQHLQLAATMKSGLPVSSPGSAAGAAPSAPPGPPTAANRLFNGNPTAAPSGASPPQASAPMPPNAPQAPAPAPSAQAPTAPPPGGQSPLIAASQKLIQVPQADGSVKLVPQYVIDGFQTPQAWVQHAAQVAAQQGHSHAVVAAVTNAAAQARASEGPSAADPQLRAALSDTAYRLPTPPVVAGRTQSPADAEQAKSNVTARNDLLQTQGDNSKAAGQALRFYALAQDVVNSGNVTTGWGAERAAAAGSFLSQFGIDKTMLGDPSKSAELVKALTNAGLQNLKSTYGAKITQSEVFLNLQHANPNIDMPLPALKQLINDQADNLKYDVGGAQRANKYLAAGNDPRQFDTWQQQYYPRQSAAVNQGGLNGNGPTRPGQQSSGAAPVRTASGPNGQKLYLRNGQWVAQ
jgi:hypothetical protein